MPVVRPTKRHRAPQKKTDRQMSSDDGTNNEGLTRKVPADVRRAVRKACGFGCVVCGCAVYDYDHHSPQFKDAKTHDVAGISLLCQTCHTKKKKGLLTEEAYSQARTAPYCLREGNAWTDWVSSEPYAPQLVIGLLTLVGGSSLFRVDDEVLFGFDPPEDNGAPPSLNLRFFNDKGAEIFAVVGNEITVSSDAFDIETVGPVWTVRSALYHVDLEIRFDLLTRITVSRMKFRHGRWSIHAAPGTVALKFDDEPIETFSGRARVSGDCLFSVAADSPSLKQNGLNVVFGGNPAPVGTVPGDDGDFVLKWPGHVLYKQPDDYLTLDVDGASVLPLYTRRSLAEAAARVFGPLSEGFQPMEVTAQQCHTIVDALGNLGRLHTVALNFDKGPIGAIAYDWRKFASTVGRA